MEKSCETCKHAPNSACISTIGPCIQRDMWEPKTAVAEQAYAEPLCSTCGNFVPNVDEPCSVMCDIFGSGWIPKIEDGRSESALNDPVKYEKIKAGMTALFSRPPLSDTQKKISEVCDEVKNLLLEKNRKYGDSALNPKRVFSKASPIEQINVRIDDKISRIMSAQDDDTEDAELDLIGYLILKRVAKSFMEGE